MNPAPSARHREVRIPPAEIVGDLVLPPEPVGLILFAHGSGSSRFSSRNRQVAKALQDRSMGTLLLDLLRPEEDGDRARVFDIRLLAERLLAATGWTEAEPAVSELPLAYFGASTGAAAALAAAAELPERLAAVVSRGGRPDLAGASLGQVRVPTLLIVGSRDEVVLDLNRQALQQLAGPAELAVVPEATHLFEEPGALEEVALLAGDWFARYLRS